MRILLIDPPYERFKGMITPYFSLGLAYIGTVLRVHGHQVAVYDAEKGENTRYLDFSTRMKRQDKYLQALEDDHNSIWKEMERVFQTFQPDIVGITCVSVKFPSALKIARICKDADKRIKVVLGGIHPTVMPNDVAKEENIDFVVKGEGERVFLELIEIIKKQGRHNGNKKIYRAKGLLNNNIIPFPNRELFINISKFHANDLGTLMLARGCPYNCSYCVTNKILNRRVIYRGIENAIDEIEHLVNRYKVTQISFLDDVFTINKGRVLEFCRLLIKRNIHINWSIITRLDLLDRDLIEIMKEAGCNYIRVGIETGSKKILELSNRGMTLEDIRQNVNILKKSNIFWGVCVIVGFPDEEERDILQTISLVKYLEPHYVTLSFFTPHPGTMYFQAAFEEGYFKISLDYARYDHHSSYNYFSKRIDKDRYYELIDKIVEEIDLYNSRGNALSDQFYSRWRGIS